MSPTRREFVKSLGAALASLATASCAAKSDDKSPKPTSTVGVTCYLPGPPTVTPTPTPSLEQQAAILTAVAEGDDIDPEVARQALGAVERDRLRSYWLGLNRLAEETRKDPEGSEQALAQLVANHWSTLNVVLDVGGLVVEDKTTVFRVQVAFSTVAYYTWCSSAPDLCSPVPEEEAFVRIDPLKQQIDRLVEMTISGDVDAAAVADARSHIVMYLSDTLAIWDAAMWPLCDELVEMASVGEDFPSLDARSDFGWERKRSWGHETDIIVDLILEEMA